MSNLRLSTTSYAVLGLLERCQPATPYQLKQIAQVSIFHFWTIPHTQLYTECARLAEAGLLIEEREEGGRRRRLYRLTGSGLHALSEWRSAPETDLYELRDPGLLKLFCGAEPEALATRQLASHRQRLALYEHLASPEANHLASSGEHLASPEANHLASSGEHLASPEANHLASSGEHLASPEAKPPLSAGEEMTVGMRLALEAGLAHEREYVRFWSRVLEEGPGDAGPQRPSA